jgi:proline racemase/trans-L-3-hydroxyproline dehydratase
MKIRRFVHVVDTHTAGEPTRVVLDGLPPIPGKTMAERRAWFDGPGNDLRRFLLQEPRGHPDMFGAVITTPVNPTADYGLIFLDNGGTLSMCGHGTIGAVTALAELGRIHKEEVLLDTPSGLVTCHLHWKEGGVQDVTLRNVPSFFLKTVQWKGIPLHLSYGGNLFALVEASSLGVELKRQNIRKIVDLGMTIRNWINRNLTLRHPATGKPLLVDLVEFYEETEPPRNVVVFGKGQVDRSPCGTGTCAKMAFLHAEGKLVVGEEYRHQSILRTEFTGKVVSETNVGDTPGIIPEVRGSAYVMAISSLVLTDRDPFPIGFDLEGDYGEE